MPIDPEVQAELDKLSAQILELSKVVAMLSARSYPTVARDPHAQAMMDDNGVIWNKGGP
jgi:hypothetical protein